jgi:hypothetical protein
VSQVNKDYKRKPLDIFRISLRLRKTSLSPINWQLLGIILGFSLRKKALELVDPVTLSEILSTLKGFTASKSPGPDGWTVEFFLAFFDLLGNELWRWLKSLDRKGRVSGALNATFLALIPKSDKP